MKDIIDFNTIEFDNGLTINCMVNPTMKLLLLFPETPEANDFITASDTRSKSSMFAKDYKFKALGITKDKKYILYGCFILICSKSPFLSYDHYEY